MNLTTPVSPFNGSSECESSSTRTKREKQENDTERELANHTWQFSSLEVARMLSPKRPKPGVEAAGEILRLDQYACVVDGLVFQNALDDVVTQLENGIKPTPRLLDDYDLAPFLTRCVEACHDALDGQQHAPPRQDRWYKDLDFTLTGVLVAPSGEPVPLKADIADEQEPSILGNQTLSCSSPEDGSAHRITLLVGAEGSWKKTVSQAYDIVCGLFGASQIRSFVLILAFNRDSKALQFLIFHHGGLTASKPCDLTDPGGLKEVLRIFLALAFWCT